MDIEVALLPSLLKSPERLVCVVVDVLRASTTLATMFGRGLESAIIAASIDEAYELAASGDYILCGERNGLPPDGFDYGNSPVEFSRVDLIGRRAIFVTSNGTRAIGLCANAPAVFVGSVVNSAAVAEAALISAEMYGSDVAVICAGNDYGREFSLDDSVACGLIVRAMEKRSTQGLHLTDGALAAVRLADAFSGYALNAFETSSHGAELKRIGLGADLEFCAQPDQYSVAPRLERMQSGQFRLISHDQRQSVK